MNKNNKLVSTANANVLSPKDLMKVRHPDLFSDSNIDSIPSVSKPVYEYHLETLTNRKQELQFEHLCRQLAEREICPNLRGQTGPTGGGDSKVDSETYPVAEEISERWWVGYPSAGSERWAFAFSAKKNWKAKILSDVDKIVSTQRNYKYIYFITNQYVSDRIRANTEDTLSEKTGIPIYILDRTWIVETVYKSDLLTFESYLAATGVEIETRKSSVRIGPRDTAKLRELETLDKQTKDATRYRTSRYQLAEDCLRTAILARGLERSRDDVEQRFNRAARLAQDIGHNQQQLRIAYNQAWTAFWWYEDYIEFNRLYTKVEEFVEVTDLVSDVDRLFNLWMLLLPLSAEDQIKNEDLQKEKRTKTLNCILSRLAADETRPTNSLQARTSIALLKTILAYRNGKPDSVEMGWREISELIDETSNMTAYSVEQLYDIVRELGEYIDGPEFDSLYEKLAETIRIRRSEGEAGLAYFQRAEQKLAQGKPYEAIGWYGRSEEMLTKKEYHQELTHTLLGESRAFESVDLLWAARTKALAACDIAFSGFYEEGMIIPEVLFALNHVAWIELKLGRIPQILETITHARLIASQLNLTDEQNLNYEEHLSNQDVVLGIHMLNIPFESLSAVAQLPSVFARLGFVNARIAILYALGHESVVLDEDPYLDTDSIDDLYQNFVNWRNQPVADQISLHPILGDREYTVLDSTILGSKVVFEVPNNRISIGLAETLLGAMESLLSTSYEHNVFPYRERLQVKLSVTSQLMGFPQVKTHDSGDYQVEVVHPSDLDIKTVEEIVQYSEWIRDTITQLLLQFLHFPNFEEWAERVIGKERGFSRAITLGDALRMQSNVFGDLSNVKLLDWIIEDDFKYDILRAKQWMVTDKPSKDSTKREIEFGDDRPSKDFYDHEKLKHTDRSVVSPIDVKLWDKAKWSGTFFLTSPGVIPFLGFAFVDGEAGQAIFKRWHDTIGDEDIEDVIRISIIRGITKQNPAEYAVLVGPNLQRLFNNVNKLVMGISRILRMKPTSTTNLDRFISDYEKAGTFMLVPASIDSVMESPSLITNSIAIQKHEICIRDAWQIGVNDPDLSAFHENDEPILPAGLEDPPILEALAHKRSNRRA